MKLYYGMTMPGEGKGIDAKEAHVTTVQADAAARLGDDRSWHDHHPLDPRHDLRRHSDGFEWGYEGSGPAQLALALCADALKVPRRVKEAGLGESLPDAEVLCRRVYQDVKRLIVARFTRTESWELTEAELLAAIERVRVGG